MVRATSVAATLLPLVVSLACTDAFMAEHEVKKLPGWDKPLPSKVYAGHISAGDDGDYKMFEHYMFIESENDPKNDPFVVWTNGGPGASSFFGLFVELGPFQLSQRSLDTEAMHKSGIPTLMRNEFSWTKFANVLILNSPPPVGYSYCDPVGPEGDGYSCGNWTDERTAKHNRIFLENFLKEFPEYSEHDWFITGESYAGVYVPTLVRELLDRHETFPIDKLKGFAVGDGCAGTEINCSPANQPGKPLFDVEFLRGHGQISGKLYRAIMETCTLDELRNGVKDKTCKAHVDQVAKQAGGYFSYNLYDECWYDNGFGNQPTAAPAKPATSATIDAEGASTLRGNVNTQTQPQDGEGYEEVQDRRRLPALNDYPCGGTRALNLWLDHPEVRKALHVGAKDVFFSGDNAVGFPYAMTEKNLMPFYKRAIKDTKLRVIVYNGDTDPGLNSFMAEDWTSGLGIPEKKAWSPWTMDGKEEMGGYVTQYENDFDFLTIRGSGHMVPQYKPKATYEFITKWIKNEPYQTYKKVTPGAADAVKTPVTIIDTPVVVLHEDEE